MRSETGQRVVGTEPRRRAIPAALIGVIVLLTVLTAAALALRVAGLAWGRPWVYHPDEWAVANPALAMVRTGTWIPNAFFYPSGLLYVERFIIEILHWLDPSMSVDTAVAMGYGGLPWRGWANADPAQFPYFYAGRAFVAVVGALTVVPTYLAARSTTGRAGALVAALAIAVAPLAVVNAHYLTTDVPVAALTVVTLWLSLRGIDGGARWLVAAGFVAGIAASTKYNAGLVVIVPIVVWATSRSPRELLRIRVLAVAALIALASMAAFALVTPAILVDPATVWTKGILWQVQGYAAGKPGAEGTDNFIYYIRLLWSSSGFGPGLSILAGIGLVLAIVRHRRADLAVLSFVIAYYVMISVPLVRFDRNLVPLLPFLAVLVGQAVDWLIALVASGLRRRADLARPVALAAGLAIVAIAAWPSVVSSISRDQVFRQPDTRTTALQWILRNIPPGATIARENYTPQVPFPEYRVGFQGQLADHPLEWYRSAGFEYAITGSYLFDRFAGREPQDSFYKALLAEPIVLDLRPEPGQPGPRIVIVRLRPAAGVAPDG